MTIVATLAAVATVTGTPEPSVEALAYIAPDPLVPTTNTVTADATYDGSLVAAAIPGATHQIVALRVTVGGVELPIAKVLPGASIQRARGERATFTIPMLLRSEWPAAWTYPVGRPEAFLGPPPGSGTITIDGLYATASGLKVVRLVTDGIADNSRESFGRLDTFELSGLGPGGRYDRAKVTLSLPPGHGTGRAALLGQVAALAGVDDYAFSAPGRVDKEVRADQAEFLALAAALLVPAGRVPHWLYDGTLTDVQRVQKERRYDFIFDDSTILLSPDAGRTTNTDGPTTIIVTGTRQVTRADCGIRVETQFVETFAIYKPVEAAFRQETTGTLTAETPAEFASMRLVGRVTTLKEFDCDRLIQERVITQGYYLPGMYRYEQDTSGQPSAWSRCWIVDPEAVGNDGALGYRWKAERFVTLSDIVTTHSYDAEGYEVGKVTTARGWDQHRAPVKEQPNPSLPKPWEPSAANGGVDYTAGQEVLGNGEAVSDLVERYYGPYYSVSRNAATNWIPQVGGGILEAGTAPGLSVASTLIQNADGFKVRETERKEEWIIRTATGGQFLFHDDTRSNDSAPLFLLSGTVDAVYLSDGESSHSKLTARTDHAGRPITDGEANTIESGLDGYLTPAELAAGLDPGTADGLPASRSESQPISYTLTVDVPPSIRAPFTETISDPWAENEAELEQIARDEMAERWAFKVTITLPACWVIRETHRVLVRIRRVGLVAEVDVKRVGHSLAAPGAMWTTTVEGDQYVV